MNRMALFSFLLLIAVLAAACANATDGAPQASSSPALTSGKDIYGALCAKCHGLTGLGDGPSVGSLRVQAGLNVTILGSQSDDDIFKTISAGKGDEMPPFELRLTTDERREAVKYVRTLAKK